MGDVDLKVIKATQLSLGKHVKKPQLTEKLLSKPPFRFLHDIVKAIITETGFLDGLFTDEELNYENIKDKDSKLAFLNKLIGVVKLTSGKSLAVKSSKIVAGQEAHRTNELLQAIAYCVDEKADPKEAIKLILNNVRAGEKKTTGKTIKDTKPAPVKGKETKAGSTVVKREVVKNGGTQASKKPDPKLERNKKEVPTRTIASKSKKADVKSKDEPKVKEESKAKKIERQNTVTLKDSSLERSVAIDNNSSLDTPKSLDSATEVPQAVSIEPENGINTTENGFPEQHQQLQPPEPEKPVEQEVQPPPVPVDPVRQMLEQVKQFKLPEEVAAPKEPDSKEINAFLANGVRRKNSTENPDKIEIPKEFQEKIETGFAPIESARRGSMPLVDVPSDTPKRNSAIAKRFMKTQSEEKIAQLRPPSVRPPSARPGAPKRREKSIEASDQSDANFGSQRNLPKLDFFDDDLDDNIDNLIIIADPMVNGDNFYDQKTIEREEVKEILETQQKLDGEAGLNDYNSPGPWESLMDSHRLSSAKTEDLRSSIQTLTKSINPLGNLLDFIQEDIDIMQIELNQQMNLYNNATMELENEKTKTDAAIKPFRQQLLELQEDIKYHKAVIRDKQCSVLMNEQKIQKTLNDL